MWIYNDVEKSKIVFCMLVDNLTRGLITPGFSFAEGLQALAVYKSNQTPNILQ